MALILFLPTLAIAGGPKWSYPTTRGLDDEMNNIYHDIKNPIINYGSASSFTVTQLTVSTATITNIVGSTTGVDAAAGNVGESINSSAAGVNLPGNNTWGDLTSITLTPGDWDLSGMVVFRRNGATLASSDWEVGISPNSGNNSTGLTIGLNYAIFDPNNTSQNYGTVVVPFYRVNITVTTTYYLKFYQNLTSSGQMLGYGSIWSRRRR